MKQEDIKKGIVTCEYLIKILESQIERGKVGKTWILPGSTMEDNIRHWQNKIKEHKSTIVHLRR